MARAPREPRRSRGERGSTSRSQTSSSQSAPASGASSLADRFVSRGSNRVFVVIVFFIIMALMFLGRLIYLQVIVAAEYSANAEASRTVGFYVEPRRGTIYDRNGHILAISVDAMTVYANPSEITEPGSTARAIAEVLGGTPSDYIDSVSQGKSATFSFVKRKVSVELADKLRELELPGIYFIEDTRREYPYGQTGGQVIGACSVAVDEENNREYYEGICGLEMYYNTILSGTEGYYEAEVGADGTPIPGGVHVSKREVEGQDIVISIDIEFQEVLESCLKNGMDMIGNKRGSAVVMDATNGEIYAAASTPFFNPADRSVVPEGSMQLRVATSLFEPGSIFKTVSATAILEKGTMTPDTKVDCPAVIEADGYVISDAHERADTVYTLRDIIKYSSNVGISLSVEQNLGFSEFYDAILRYRFNQLTGIDYPGEQLGYLLDFDYWSRVQGYNVTFGQGISMNAMQILGFYGALINEGVEVTPHFLVRKPQTNETPTYETHQIIENQKAIDTMLDMLTSVTKDDGTGIEAAIEGYDVAGKTSTAEIYDEVNGGYKLDAYNLAFTGFILNSNSPFVCFVGGDEVSGDRPVTFIFHDIMLDAINRYNITPE